MAADKKCLGIILMCFFGNLYLAYGSLEWPHTIGAKQKGIKTVANKAEESCILQIKSANFEL